MRVKSLRYTSDCALSILSATIRSRSCDDAKQMKVRLASTRDVERLLSSVVRDYQRCDNPDIVNSVVSHAMCIVYELETYLYDTVRDETSTRLFDLCMQCLRRGHAVANAEISAWRILFDHPDFATRDGSLEYLCRDDRQSRSCVRCVVGGRQCAFCPSKFDSACLLTLKRMNDADLVGKNVRSRLRSMVRSTCNSCARTRAPCSSAWSVWSKSRAAREALLREEQDEGGGRQPSSRTKARVRRRRRRRGSTRATCRNPCAS